MKGCHTAFHSKCIIVFLDILPQDSLLHKFKVKGKILELLSLKSYKVICVIGKKKCLEFLNAAIITRSFL